MDHAALRRRLDAATAGLEAPFAVVDLDAFDANAADMVRRAGGTPIRLASKSVRCVALLRRALERPGFAGVLAFTLPEALWLARQGFEDVVVAYPTADRHAVGELAADARLRERVTVMVDDVAHLDLLADATGSDPVALPDATGSDPVALRVCLDLDTSWRPLGGRVRIGARRSPLRTPAQAAALARAALDRGLVVDGVMAYEAQVAGVGDAPPGKRLYGTALRAVQAGSMRELRARRAAVVAAVRGVVPDLRFVNGGGTGSLERTAAEPAVTELGAGSGLFGPTLFDGYRAFRPRPAALFALPVVRRPGPGVATVLGGGYPASGAAGRDRLVSPFLPDGLRLDGQEGAGEVQTPVLGAAADGLRIGDRVWARHAKAGELCERFAALHLVAGDEVVETVPTYRGEGQTFL
ncbi:amino acid deaminase/aldolase [Conexibacter sp. SYSU D00693]|uniref:amino acid deaminase/aldolase n=1 Tax=Conexibacter sp. SYSU D00693 TaxID=2812560 RepID=UPI00196B63AA|nr:amino acid deaminase/aldolase [Conexibacter sp. SYSU D00693]